MARILVSGSIAYDRIMNFPGLFSEHFMPEMLHNINVSFQVDDVSVQFGGTAGNIAYSLALLGEKSDVIASAGDDFEPYRVRLGSFGIDPAPIQILPGKMTASAYILTDKADNQIAAFHYGAGSASYEGVLKTDEAAFAIIAPGCLPDMESLPSRYKNAGLRYFYDPAQQIPVLRPEVLKESIQGAQILFGSDYEYELIKQKTGWSEKKLLKHVPTIVVTYGAKGSSIITAGGTTKVAASPAQALVDPTGAGDAYRAGFMKGLVANLSLESCAKLGSVVAAYVVETKGTQNHRFTLEDIQKRYKKTYGEELVLT